jgi:hypothetical protein
MSRALSSGQSPTFSSSRQSLSGGQHSVMTPQGSLVRHTPELKQQSPPSQLQQLQTPGQHAASHDALDRSDSMPMQLQPTNLEAVTGTAMGAPFVSSDSQLNSPGGVPSQQLQESSPDVYRTPSGLSRIMAAIKQAPHAMAGMVSGSASATQHSNSGTGLEGQQPQQRANSAEQAQPVRGHSLGPGIREATCAEWHESVSILFCDIVG